MTTARFVSVGKDGNRYTNVDCPHRFCKGKIVYNGNYFCEHFGESCNWSLEHDEYEQVYRKGPNAGWYQIIVHEASPLHKKVWEKIIIDVWGSREAYDKSQKKFLEENAAFWKGGKK